MSEEEDELTPHDVRQVLRLHGNSTAAMKCPGCGREFTVSASQHVFAYDDPTGDLLDGLLAEGEE